MKKPLRFKVVVWTAFIFFCIQSFSQVPFTPVQNSTMTINGELKTIGNTIVGFNQIIDDVVYTPNDNYNGNISNNRKIFDYIDVDNDQSTFSSSSAVFTSSGSCAKVAYAGLYWAATYFVDRSTTNSNNILYDNLPFPDNRPDFRTLKFKPPGVVDYIDIPSSDTQVIFDGYRNTLTNPNNTAILDIPYVCYTDVTNIVKNLPTPDGTYTVANMRASTGFSGNNTNGISGGWVLVIAYEDNSLSKKYISTQQGYINVQPCVVDPTDPLDDCLKSFTYSGFQTPPVPFPVHARYAVATLEGDRPFVGDIFQIERPDLVRQNIFTAPANPNGNFFDSSISVDGSYVTNRTPSSENTLGFDLDIFDIVNPLNYIIGNNQTSATFFTSSSSDGYSIFFNAIQVGVIEPKLIVTERVLDANGIDITGDSVNFADQLFYELTIENKGNEDFTGTIIRDVLPDNVDFIIGSIFTSNPDIIVTPNTTNREINITVADNLLVPNGGVHTVRFGVQVVPTCADLRGSCSYEINNVATYTYKGIDSDVINTGESISGQDVCGFDISSSVNTLINEGVCFTESQVAFICTGSINLTADNGFTNYTWTYDEDPSVVFPNSQTITVTLPGTYTVLNSGTPGCQDSQQTFVVDGFTTVENPVIDIARNLGSNPNVNGEPNDGTPGTGNPCPINGEPLPEIFLCGAGTTLNIPLNFPIGTTVIWERLDPAACPTVTRDPNCPTPVIDSGVCDGDWVQVSTDIGSYTVTQSGEYRIRATFDSGCTIPFYFNVFQNNFDPDLVVVREFICGTPGTLRVQNSSLEYEYQLISPSGTVSPYQASPEFVGLTTVGNYTVNVRQTGGLPASCVFQDTVFLEERISNVVVTPRSPICPGDQGDVYINVVNSETNYIYTIRSTTNNFTAIEGPTTNQEYIFAGLNPDSYEVEVLSFDGNCIDIFSIVILPADSAIASVSVIKGLGCNPNYQPDPNQPSFDPDTNIALIQIDVNGGSGNYVYSTTSDFNTQLSPEIGTTNIFRITTSGNYDFFVADQDTGCFLSIDTIVVNPYQEIQATATAIRPIYSSDNSSIQVDVTSGEGPFIYTLNGTNTVGPIDDTTYTFNNVDPSIPHNITVTDNLGCDIALPQLVFSISEPLTANFSVIRELSCISGSESAIIEVSNITGGTGEYEWSLDLVGPFTTVTGIPFAIDVANAGVYTLYIKNQGNSYIESFPIIIDPILEIDNVNVTLGDQNCFNQTLDVVVSASSAIVAPAFYEYSITPDPSTGVGSTAFSTTTTYTFSKGVNYAVTARRSDTQCTKTTSFIGDLIPEIEITSAVLTSPVTCNGDSDGALVFTVSNSDIFAYTITSESMVFESGIGIGTTPVFISSLEPGTYTITVVDTSLGGGLSNACNYMQTITIEAADPITVETIVTQPTNLQNQGEIVIYAAGGTPPYSYSINNSSPVSTNVFTNLIPGNYTITTIDSNGCKILEEVTVSPGYSTKINLQDITKHFSMYPNPSSDIVNVNAEIKSIKVFDMTGKLVLKTTQNSYNISDLHNGVYFTRVIMIDDKEIMIKLIKE